jgi:hypothetical protein
VLAAHFAKEVAEFGAVDVFGARAEVLGCVQESFAKDPARVVVVSW